MRDLIVATSAPGKVVLCGEYAVLDGAPAVCMAVNARATVSVSTASGDHHVVVAPGHCDRETRFRDDDGSLEWQGDGEPFALLQAAWRQAGLRPSSALSFCLDTTAFREPESGRKIGIGSSAALAVALAAAFGAMQRNDDALVVAHRAHRELQRGRGSGADVAAAAAGGVIEYRIEGRRSAHLAWPAGLAYRLLFSGSAADTRARIERYEAGGGGTSEAQLVAAAERAADAWRSGSAAAILDECRAYTAALERLSVDRDLGIFDAGHAEVVAAADASGLVYKPCGAGGGDIGIVLADDRGTIDDFIAGGLPAGFRALDLVIDERGVDVAGGMK